MDVRPYYRSSVTVACCVWLTVYDVRGVWLAMCLFMLKNYGFLVTSHKMTWNCLKRS